MSALRQRWDALGSGEQRTLRIGGAVVTLILGYLLLFEPMWQARDEARVQLAGARADLDWMRAVAPTLRTGAATPPVFAQDGRSLLARVDASARESRLGTALVRVEPVAAGQVRAYFERAGFDALMRWVEQLSQQHGARVNELSAQRADGVGLVDARLSLEETTH
jgi:general secretion pathway protein M